MNEFGGCVHVDPSGQKSAAFPVIWVRAGRGAGEQCRADGERVGRPALGDLQARQQRRVAGDEGRRVARAALAFGAAARRRGQHVVAGRQQPLAAVDLAVVARRQRLARRVHRPDRQHARCGRRHVQAVAAVIARRRDDQHATRRAALDRLRQHRLRRAGRRKLAAGDVDEVRAVLQCREQGAREIELRAGEAFCPAILEDRDDQPPAARRDALHRAARLAEDDAGDLGAVPRRGVARIELRLSVREFQQRALEAGMAGIDGTVEHRHRYARITLCEFAQPRHGVPPREYTPILFWLCQS
ncbi:hypothetical protein [Mesorhizobium sp. KR9-304]|uniref:hypothetical protein n=1 Tax=Mesorhizobium sp. KR9-304 TaxID=3156614 RepID=UPI0032B44538